MYRRDYYPEYKERTTMNFREEIADLKKFYKERLEESSRIIDERFPEMIDMLEDFIKDYRQNEKYFQSYNNLIEKVEKENADMKMENLKRILRESCGGENE